MKKRIVRITPAEMFKTFENESIEDEFMVSENILDIAFFDQNDKNEILNLPFYLEDVIFLMCLKGSLNVKLEIKDFVLVENCVFVILPKQVFEIKHISDDFKAIIFFMKTGFWENKGNFWETTKIQEYFFKENELIFSKKNMKEVMLIYKLIKAKIDSKTPFSKQIIQQYINVLFYIVQGILIQKEKTKQIDSQPIKEYVFKQYIRLLERNYKQQHELGFYAERLKMTAKYLSATVRSASGKTAAQWIHEYLIMEARALLKSGKMSIQQVAFELNFFDQSHFGVFFKKHVGCSPREYQRR